MGTIHRHHSVLQQFRLGSLTVDQFGNGVFHGTVHGTNVTALEASVNQLQGRITGMAHEYNTRIKDLEETLTARIAALEAQMAARTSD